MSLTADTPAGAAVPTATPTFSPEDIFFSTKGTNFAFTNSTVIPYAPSSSLNSHLLTFEVNKLAPPTVYYLNDLTLSCMVKLEDSKGNKPRDDAMLAPVNMFGAAMVRTARLFANDKCFMHVEISTAESGLFPLRAYLSKTTGMSQQAKVAQAQCEGFYSDLGGQFQLLNDEAVGFAQRRSLFGQYNQVNVESDDGSVETKSVFEYYNHAVPVYIKLLSDWSTCSLPIVSDVSLRVEIVLSDPDFYLTCLDPDAADKGYRLTLTSCQMLLPTKQLNPSLQLGLERKMLEKPIKYPLTRVEGKCLSLAAHIQTYSTDGLVFSTVNPTRIMLTMIPSYLWSGGITTNPFEALLKFKDYHRALVKLTRISLSVSSVPLEVDASGNHEQLMLQLYRQLYMNLGQYGTQNGCGISYDDFKSGYGIILYDLTAAYRATESSEAVQPVKSGHLRLDMSFDQPLPYPVNLFVLSEFEANVTITKSRAVTYNYMG